MANNLWEDKEIHLDSGDKGFMYVLSYYTTVKLGDKEQIGVKEPFPVTNCHCT